MMRIEVDVNRSLAEGELRPSEDGGQALEPRPPRRSIGMSPDAEREALRALARLGAEAAKAYEVCARLVAVAGLERTWETFREDHERHAAELEELCEARGAGLTAGEDRVAGALLGDLARLAGTVAPGAALLLLTHVEELTNTAYDAALDLAFDERTHGVLERQFHEERRHLAFLSDLLEEAADSEP